MAQQQTVVEYSWQDYKDLIHWSQTTEHVVAIFDYCDVDLYSSFYNDRCALDHNGIEYDNLLDMMAVYENTFYTNTADLFDREIWDLREKLALIYNFPKKIKNFNNYNVDIKNNINFVNNGFEYIFTKYINNNTHSNIIIRRYLL